MRALGIQMLIAVTRAQGIQMLIAVTRAQGILVQAETITEVTAVQYLTEAV